MAQRSPELSVLYPEPVEALTSTGVSERVQKIAEGIYLMLRKMYDAGDIDLHKIDPTHDDQLMDVAQRAAVIANAEVEELERPASTKGGWD